MRLRYDHEPSTERAENRDRDQTCQNAPRSVTAMPPRVVIVGGGFGGLDAARALAGAPVRVTLLDRHNYHLFQPLLYQVATASLSPGDVASPIRWILRQQKNVEVLLADAREIDPVGRRVMLGPTPVAHLTRSRSRRVHRLRLPDRRDRRGARLLRSSRMGGARAGPQDARRCARDAAAGAARVRSRRARDAIPTRQRRLLTFVIVGGGPTGVELAGALAEIARQSLRQDFRRIQPGVGAHRAGRRQPAPARRRFPSRLRDAARRSLERLGVEVRTGSVVTGVDADGVMLACGTGARRRRSGARRAHRRRRPCCGRPASRRRRWRRRSACRSIASAACSPEPTLARARPSEIFVVGDVCALQQDGKLLPGVAQVAMQEGAHAARNILRADRGRAARAVPLSDYGNMATIGRGSAVGDIGRPQDRPVSSPGSSGSSCTSSG